MRVKQIIIFMFILNLSVFSNALFSLDNCETFSTENESLFKEITEIDSAELGQIIGLPYIKRNSFGITCRNDHGEAVGFANFRDAAHKKTESLLWFWDSKDGFQEIIWFSDLQKERFDYFYFHDSATEHNVGRSLRQNLLINEK